MEFILDFILHIDQYTISIVQDYHTCTGLNTKCGMNEM